VVGLGGCSGFFFFQDQLLAPILHLRGGEGKKCLSCLGSCSWLGWCIPSSVLGSLGVGGCNMQDEYNTKKSPLHVKGCLFGV